MSEVETEEQLTRTEIATYLRAFADQLDADGAVTLELGGRGVTLDPVDPVTFKLEGEVDQSGAETGAKESIEFELVWWTETSTAEMGGETSGSP